MALKDNIKDILDKHTAEREISVKPRKPAPWITPAVKAAKQKQRQAERQWRKLGTQVHRDIYIHHRQNTKSIIMDSKSDGIDTILRQMVDAFNSNNARGDSILLNATWIKADIDNMCDLIRAICKRLDSGTFLLLGSSSSRSYNTIQSYSQALHVPYLLFSETANQPGDGYRYDLSVSPSYVRPVADLVKFFNWEEMYYIFDADDGE
ncbi:glutamate receptor subunit protein GluR2 precursor [Elysia marginata]|uniref:Glutamate receptor subunit protein GluR2 n=1 Tax=Elysia marginata TaxID=1093978 RepID=A0AAV4I5H2_9GAST|nr:glutamate receptor subunit protein GluR2 precursor [Elysia marginata]